MLMRGALLLLVTNGLLATAQIARDNFRKSNRTDRTGHQVPQEQLEPVLRVASQLKIRGLDSDYSRESSLEPERYFLVNNP